MTSGYPSGRGPRFYNSYYNRRHHHMHRRAQAAGVIQNAWRHRRRRTKWGHGAKYSNTKSVRSVNAPNMQRFRGKNLVEGHKYIGKFNTKMLKGLTGTGILEKRLIRHLPVDYDSPSLIASLNTTLKSMSGKIINYSNNDPSPEDINSNTGIPVPLSAQAFAISSSVSNDRYVFYKNFRTEITINTEASSFAGAPDPTQQAQLGYVNTLNFRVLFVKRKPGTVLKNVTSGLDTEPTIANSLFLGYDNVPFGLTRRYGEGATSIVGRPAPFDVQLGTVNKGMWQVLQDKQFPLSVPVANVAGAESKYPNYKKLVFSHKINEKVLVSTTSVGTFPLDWDSKYQVIILAGIPNSSVATLATPTSVIPQTNRLWKVSLRGFTSYMDS